MVNSQTVNNIQEIFAFDENNIVVVGLQKAMRTNDGGENWIEFEVPNNRISGACFLDAMHGWVGSGGYNNTHVFYASDGGENWQSINKDKYPVIIDFHFLNSDTGFMASRD